MFVRALTELMRLVRARADAVTQPGLLDIPWDRLQKTAGACGPRGRYLLFLRFHLAKSSANVVRYESKGKIEVCGFEMTGDELEVSQ